jgi:hypothetical protein
LHSKKQRDKEIRKCKMKLMIEQEEENKHKSNLNLNYKELEILKRKELQKDNKWKNRLEMMLRKSD